MTVDLRAALLASKPADYGLAPTTELPHVWAVLMEMQMTGAVASVVAVADGSTSLYLSSGGGILGGHAHDAVREANRKLLLACEKLLAGFVAKAEPTKVLPNAVSFVLLTHEGMRVARDTEERLKSKTSPLWPAFYLGHGVISALRTSTQETPGR